MTGIQRILIRWLSQRIINRTTFIYYWQQEQNKIHAANNRVYNIIT